MNNGFAWNRKYLISRVFQRDRDPNCLTLKEVFEKVDFEKNQQTTKEYENYPEGKELRIFHLMTQ